MIYLIIDELFIAYKMAESVKYEATAFVDNLDVGKHVVLFYETFEYGLMLQLQYIRNGLLKGEHCIYGTHGDPMYIENQMAYSGINVEEFRRKKLLHIYNIPDLMDDPDGPVKGAEKIEKKILAESKPPFRVVSVFVPEINTEVQMRAQLDIERNLHASFSNRQCLWLCPYDLAKIEDSMKEKFMDGVLQNHHAVVSVSASGGGIGFNIRRT
jgi:hypothetical protein